MHLYVQQTDLLHQILTVNVLLNAIALKIIFIIYIHCNISNNNLILAIPLELEDWCIYL